MLSVVKTEGATVSQSTVAAGLAAESAACDRRANAPPALPASSWGTPCSTSRPELSTRSWSQSMMVSILCAMTCRLGRPQAWHGLSLSCGVHARLPQDKHPAR